MAKKEKYFITKSDKTRTLFITCYDEQMPNGWEYVCDQIKKVEKKYHVSGICHSRTIDRDKTGIHNEDNVVYKKKHYHIAFRCADKKISPIRVSTVLNMLGIVFRPEIDDLLWKKDGVDTIHKGYASAVSYLIHDTEECESKPTEEAPYEIEEIISNLIIEELKQVLEGYSHFATSEKLTMADYENLDKEAYQMGYELKDFDAWYGSLPFVVRCNTKMRVIRESYDRGIKERAKQSDIEILRLCVFIQGAGNLGKSYACSYALKDYNTLKVNGGKTGRYDNLTVSTQALFVDDDHGTNILGFCGSSMVQAYKRGSNNPWWCGDRYIVTYNSSFEKWLNLSGVTTKEWNKDINHEVPTQEYEAALSRFFVCHLERRNGVTRLVCDSVCNRGTYEDQMRRKAMFIEFRDKFNECISQYTPSENEVDYSDIND